MCQWNLLCKDRIWEMSSRGKSVHFWRRLRILTLSVSFWEISRLQTRRRGARIVARVCFWIAWQSSGNERNGSHPAFGDFPQAAFASALGSSSRMLVHWHYLPLLVYLEALYVPIENMSESCSEHICSFLSEVLLCLIHYRYKVHAPEMQVIENLKVFDAWQRFVNRSVKEERFDMHFWGFWYVEFMYQSILVEKCLWTIQERASRGSALSTPAWN